MSKPFLVSDRIEDLIGEPLTPWQRWVVDGDIPAPPELERLVRNAREHNAKLNRWYPGPSGARGP